MKQTCTILALTFTILAITTGCGGENGNTQAEEADGNVQTGDSVTSTGSISSDDAATDDTEYTEEDFALNCDTDYSMLVQEDKIENLGFTLKIFEDGELIAIWTMKPFNLSRFDDPSSDKHIIYKRDEISRYWIVEGGEATEISESDFKDFGSGRIENAFFEGLRLETIDKWETYTGLGSWGPIPLNNGQTLQMEGDELGPKVGKATIYDSEGAIVSVTEYDYCNVGAVDDSLFEI